MDSARVLSEDQRERFERRGLIRLDGLIPEATVSPARDLALAELERAGVWSDDAWVGEIDHDGLLQAKLLKSLKQVTKKSARYEALDTADLREAITQLVDGRQFRALTACPQLLCTPPNATEWVVPHNVWHLDVPRLGEVGLPGVQMFSFLNRVEPGAGGTLVLAGSHRLLNDGGRIKSAEVKKALKREPYFHELFRPRSDDRQHFIDEPGHVGDVELQVVELCGAPGDVFLMDLRLFHTLAPNASLIPRLMVTQRFVIESVMGDAFGG